MAHWWVKLRNLAAALLYTVFIVSVLVYIPRNILLSKRSDDGWIDPMKGRLVMPLPVDFDEDHTPVTGPPPSMAKYLRTRAYKLGKYVISGDEGNIRDVKGSIIIKRPANASLDLPSNFSVWDCPQKDSHKQSNRDINELNNMLQGIHERTLFIITGSSTETNVCERINTDYPRVQCLDASTGLLDQTDLIDGQSQSALKWGQRAYVQLLTLRALVLRGIAKLNRPFVLFETDAVWPRNPVDFFDNYANDADIVVPIKGYPDKGLTLSFDPLVVRPTNASVAFLERMCRGLVTDNTAYDQDLLDTLCKQQYSGVNCATFDWEEVADGLWYKLSSIERRTLHPYVINNNFIIGVDAKITRQALNGHWFLRVNHTCNVERATKFVTEADDNMKKGKNTLLQVKFS